VFPGITRHGLMGAAGVVGAAGYRRNVTSDASPEHTQGSDPVAVLDLNKGYRMHPSVAVRPEPFGALVYHYGNRKLVFLKSPRMVSVVQTLDQHPSLDAVFDSHELTATQRPKYVAALESLLKSDMIVAAPKVEV
jgi:mycofactocin biosynthesis protein MftB